jgi:uncharacterized repeat protein (TIGR01451 family)
VTVGTAAGLVLTMQVNPAQQLDGFDVTYTLILHNTGPSTASDVTVTDPFPGVTVVGPNTPSQGTFDPTTGVWSVGTLAAGATATLTVTSRVEVLGPITNTAHAAADQFDPDLSNNSSTASLTGMMPPDQISKRAFLSGAADPPPLAAALAAGGTTAPATQPAASVAALLAARLAGASDAAGTTAPAPAATAAAIPPPTTASTTGGSVAGALVGAGLQSGGGGNAASPADVPAAETSVTPGDGPVVPTAADDQTGPVPGDPSGLDRCLTEWGRVAETEAVRPVSWFRDDLPVGLGAADDGPNGAAGDEWAALAVAGLLSSAPVWTGGVGNEGRRAPARRQLWGA